MLSRAAAPDAPAPAAWRAQKRKQAQDTQSPITPSSNLCRDLLSAMVQPVYGPGFAQTIDGSQSASAFFLLRFCTATLAWTVARAKTEMPTKLGTSFGNALVVAVAEVSTWSRRRGREVVAVGMGGDGFDAAVRSQRTGCTLLGTGVEAGRPGCWYLCLNG